MPPRPVTFRERSLSRGLLCLFAWATAASVVAGCRGAIPDPAFVQLEEARHVTADLRVAFAKAVSASDRAVMADTDEASNAFAREAERAASNADSDARALAPRFKSLGYQTEARLLEEFAGRLAEYRKLDRNILRLAVENTNLKAQRLSFGPVRDAADAVRDFLQELPKAANAKGRCRVETLVATVLLAVRETQMLQAPHIAEAADEEMDRLEKEMAVRQLSIRAAMTSLGELAAPTARSALTKANAALAQFETQSREVITLSRRNTNVRSLALSLGQKATLAAACDATLVALAEALAKEGSRAMR